MTQGICQSNRFSGDASLFWLKKLVFDIRTVAMVAQLVYASLSILGDGRETMEEYIDDAEDESEQRES